MLSALLLRGSAVPWRLVALVLLAAALAIGGGAALRSTEYDETYTRLVASPMPRPAWPEAPFTPREAMPVLEAVAGPAQIARNLRETDVHPPLYFWLAGGWRAAGGTSVEALRALSVLFALGAVAAFMAAAAAAGLPPLAVGLATALAYGFAYTGGIARGYALALLLLGLAALGIVLAWRRGSAGLAALGGLAAGGASFANYLAAFPAAAMVGWLLVAPMPLRRRAALIGAAALPFLALQLANLSFFFEQRDTRPDQFERFQPLAALTLLAQYNAASLLGGIPLYLQGAARLVASAALVSVLAAAALAVALRWPGLGPTRWLWLGGFLAPSAGLLLLGAAFGTTPIELRYLAFAAPFAAALLAGAAASWATCAPRLAPAALGLVLLLQAAGVAGMALHPATQQTYRRALAAVAPALGPGSLLLVPRGNDGVGIVGAVLAEAPPDQPILVLDDASLMALPSLAAGHARLVLLGIADRDGALQREAAARVLAEAGGWVAQPQAWRDAPRDFFATIYLAAPEAASRMANGAEGVVIRRTDHGSKEP